MARTPSGSAPSTAISPTLVGWLPPAETIQISCESFRNAIVRAFGAKVGELRPGMSRIKRGSEPSGIARQSLVQRTNAMPPAGSLLLG